MWVADALCWTGIPLRVYSYLAASVSRIHCDWLKQCSYFRFRPVFFVSDGQHDHLHIFEYRGSDS